MKRNTFFTVVSVMALCGQALAINAKPSTIKSFINEVTVYPDRAKVTRMGRLTLSAGDHTVLFENLPVGAEEASFRASAKGAEEITLLGLNHKVVQHLETPQQKVAELEKQIDSLERNKKQRVADRLAVFEAQKELLLAISKGGGEETSREVKRGGIDVKSWDAAYAFFGSKLTLVTDSMRIARQEMEDINKTLEHLRSELRTIQSTKSRSTKTVQVDLRLAQEGEVEVTLEYMIGRAMWKPLYDARLVSDKDLVELSCFAEVTQRTGEDWENVNLILSTAQPSQGISPGDFRPWYLEVREVPKIKRASKIKVGRETIEVKPVTTVEELLSQVEGVATGKDSEIFIRGGGAGDVSHILDGVPIDDPLAGVSQAAAGLQMGTGVSTIGLSTVFVVERKESVSSGGESVRVPIGRWTLEGETKHISRPKNTEGAFRVIKLTNQDEVPLMPGQVSVFAETDFLGKTALSELIAPDQTFDLPFGRDDNISVKREIISRKKQVKTDKIRVEQTIKISLKNNGRAARVVSLEEPMPTSRDSRVKVKVTEVEPEPLSTDVQGKATWDVSLSPGEEKSVMISYRVEYPKGVVVPGL
ncbi:MAG: mucoidy inhibitor MuiA family protein [Candidatus Zixiibacteriota bacterium]